MPKDLRHRIHMQQGAVQTDADRNQQANNDADIIRKAYEEIIQSNFKIFYHAAFESKPTPDEVQQAETRFRHGVTLARQARDRAIALLAP